MMKILLISFLILSSLLTHAQPRYLNFFKGIKHYSELDSIPLNEFQAIATKRKKDYLQVMFDYGSNKKRDWSYAYDYLTEYADIGLPKITKIALNEKEYLIISMNAGAEYRHYGIYKFSNNVATNLYWEDLLFYGQMPNNDLITWLPACCDDPTSEFKRIRFNPDQTTTTIDSFSISRSTPYTQVICDSIFLNKEWSITTDTLYASRSNYPQETFGAFLPGARKRLIKTQEFDGISLEFCEVIGTSYTVEKYNQVCNHAFVWLSRRYNPE